MPLYRATGNELTALVAADGSSGGFVKDADRATDADARAQTSTTAVLTPANLAGRASFSAHKNAVNQTGVADGATVKVTMDTEVFDVGGLYDAAQSRWTPPAGRIRLSARIAATGVKASGGIQAYIYKNGALLRLGSYFPLQTGNSSVSCLDVANGTDYYELYAYADATTTVTLVGVINATYFEGEQI